MLRNNKQLIRAFKKAKSRKGYTFSIHLERLFQKEEYINCDVNDLIILCNSKKDFIHTIIDSTTNNQMRLFETDHISLMTDYYFKVISISIY